MSEGRGITAGRGTALIRIAAAQVSCTLGNVGKNLEHIVQVLQQAAEQDVKLVVFPECATSGYVFDDLVSARQAAITLDGPEVGQIAHECARLDIFAVIGALEEAGDAVYNTAILMGPKGLIGRYRKSHLPYLGVDRFVTKGDGVNPPVFQTEIGCIGLAICYDIRFPEWARVLALAGADIIAQPSNWPVQAKILSEHFIPVRACENRVYFVLANRGDDERGVSFLGRSQIVDPDGNFLALAEGSEALLIADVNVALARSKRIVRQSGEYETDLFGDRRPELYRTITASRQDV